MAWDNPKDLLERATNAKFLTDYLAGQYAANEKSNFVLAIDSAWGRGKTYFLKNWKQDLESENYPVIYFDAWANDFSEDPLVALISELHDGLQPIYKKLPPAKRLSLSLKKQALKASRFGGKLMLNIMLKKLAGESIDSLYALMSEDGDVGTNSQPKAENIQDTEKASSDKETLDQAIEALADATFKEHASKKQAIDEFKKSLTSLLDAIKEKIKNKQLPLFIFIDELDRCRPNFAVEVLEVVKHLFDVPGVYFVIATHIEQLAASINVLYGEKFDSRQYLKRFFHQEYVLPDPELWDFVEYLHQHYQPLSNLPPDRVFVFFENSSKDEHDEQPNEAFSFLALAFGLTLRDMEQSMVMLKAICLTWSKGRQLHLFFLLFWIMLKQKHPAVFEKIKKTEDDISIEDVLEDHLSRAPGIRNGEFQERKTSAYELISHYFDRRNWTIDEHRKTASKGNGNAKELPSAIDIAFDNETANALMNQSSDPFAFSSYPKLVEQAGQLHN